MTFGQQGFHLLLVTSMVMFLCVRAGRRWGVDAYLFYRLAGRHRWLRLFV
jgi:hypothetical protein